MIPLEELMEGYKQFLKQTTMDDLTMKRVDIATMLSASLTCIPPKRTISSCFTAESRATKKPYNAARGIVTEIGHNTSYIQILPYGETASLVLFLFYTTGGNR